MASHGTRARAAGASSDGIRRLREEDSIRVIRGTVASDIVACGPRQAPGPWGWAGSPASPSPSARAAPRPAPPPTNGGSVQPPHRSRADAAGAATNPMSSVAGSDHVMSGSACMRVKLDGRGRWCACWVGTRSPGGARGAGPPGLHPHADLRCVRSRHASRSSRRASRPAYRPAGAAAADGAAGAAGSAKVGVDLRISISSAVMSTGISAKSGVVR
jgi:hypothetical protein